MSVLSSIVATPNYRSAARASSPAVAAPARLLSSITSVAWQTWAAWAVIAFGAVPRVWAAIWDQSVFWPDEIMQTLEQAHRMAFHRGFIPWEFRDGARSWFLPGVIGLFWRLLSALGVRHSFGLVVGAKLLMAFLGLVGMEVARRMATRLAGPTAGIVAALLIAACPLEIYFGSRVMTEVASAPCVLLAAYLLLVAGDRRPAVAGALAAATVFLRVQNGLFVAGFLLIVLLRKDWRAAARYCAGAAVVGCAGGLLDWITWGYPFQALWVNFKFNLIDGHASGFGVSPFYFYAQCLGRSVGSAFGVVLLAMAASWPRARALLILVLVYFVLHCAIPHKELRFMLPIVPLALTLAAVGLSSLCQGWTTRAAVPIAIALCCAGAMACQVIAPLQRDYTGNDSNWPIWHTGEDYFVTVWEAEKRADLCGVAFVGNDWAWTGGYTYLHRDVPVYLNLEHLTSTNYVVGRHDEKLPDGWQRLFEYKQYGLFRRDGACQADSTYRSLP